MVYPATYGPVYASTPPPPPPTQIPPPVSPSRFAASFAPAPISWLGIARELLTGSPVLPVALVPADGDAYEPEDTPHFIMDTSVRATMGALFGTIMGTQEATFTFGGPAYLDVEGYWLDNILGDLSSSSGGTLGGTQNLTIPLPAGATSLQVGASLGAVAAGSVIQILDGAASEIVIATTGSTPTSVQFAGTPCRFAHGTAATAALETASASYTHTFALLNGGTGQPVTHSLTDFTALTPGVGARTYPGAVVAELTLSGDGTGLIVTKVAGSSWLSAPAASAPIAGSLGAPPLPAWADVITVGGSPVPDVSPWAVTFRRQLVIYRAAPNTQTPFVIARGPLSVTGSLAYTVPADEGPLDALLGGAAQPVTITVSNGLSGASALAMTIQASRVQVLRAKPNRATSITGYDDEWQAIDNSTDTGGSGGLGPATVTITNAVAAY